MISVFLSPHLRKRSTGVINTAGARPRVIFLISSRGCSQTESNLPNIYFRVADSIPILSSVSSPTATTMFRNILKFLAVVLTFVLMSSMSHLSDKLFIRYFFGAINKQERGSNESGIEDLSLLVKNKSSGRYSFPVNFMIGVSSSAHQIEGAYNEDGKTMSVWDTYEHDHPELITDGSNADVTCDSYHRFLQDIEALDRVGVS